MENIEKWLPVPIDMYRLSHMVSNQGRIRSMPRKVMCKNGFFRTTTEKILKPNKDRYLSVQLSNRGKTLLIHRLVAMAFLNSKGDGLQVNHIDGNGHNNNILNLEFVTAEHNRAHSITNKLQKVFTSCKGADSPKARPVEVFDMDGNLVRKFFCVVDAAIEYNTTAKSIYRVLWGQRKKHRGLVFQYPSIIQP